MQLPFEKLTLMDWVLVVAFFIAGLLPFFKAGLEVTTLRDEASQRFRVYMFSVLSRSALRNWNGQANARQRPLRVAAGLDQQSRSARLIHSGNNPRSIRSFRAVRITGILEKILGIP